jgi:hypothetical protein
MNTTISNPTIKVSVAGVRSVETARWYGGLFAGSSIPANNTPMVIPLADSGSVIGAAAFLTVLSDGIAFTDDLTVEANVWAQCSDLGSAPKYLGVRLDSDPANQMRMQTSFVNGVATCVVSIVVGVGDTLRFVGLGTTQAFSILAGSISLRADSMLS